MDGFAAPFSLPQAPTSQLYLAYVSTACWIHQVQGCGMSVWCGCVGDALICVGVLGVVTVSVSG